GLVCLALLAVSGAAGAAGVTGTVSMAGHGAARDAVVTIEGGKTAAPLTKAVMDQRQKTFLPHVLVVTKGTKVDFPNNDTVFHNVFAYFKASKFDLGMYPSGASKSITFDKVGVVQLLCNVHSDMSAYIIVVDTPYFAKTDKSGHFQIAGVPPGSYTVRVWHESGAAVTQPLTVEAAGATVSLAIKRDK
ncbi:MAG TPA: carboxypeptidase regulatory-like domain-containing protein, partial [Chthonomonadaceae bacterium]|nr:carboxypeptidase regulatory-like domain-containing protein [Chthonomonadaceae bacterium]